MAKRTKPTSTAAVVQETSTPTPPAPPPAAPPIVASPEPPATATAQPAEPKARGPKPPDTRTFTVTEQAFTPGKGFATELYAALKALGSATPQQAADALLASGAYQRVAPKAAELRPVKPVETLLKQWLAKGVVTAK